MSMNRSESAVAAGFDVFLSHNGADKDAVLEIARRLRDVGIRAFLDIWHLVPGEPWQEALEDALDRSRSCAVFLGPTGFGPWENEEMRVALSRRVRDDEYRVIPVLLPGAELPNRGKLPAFLSRVTWADFRSGLDDAEAFDRLVSGVRGLAPLTGADLGDAVAPDNIVCPFRGLEVFDEAHAEFFFGREALTQHLVEQLRADRFLAVLGPSGSGKSSVVRAGLIPAIRRGALLGSSDWDVLIVRPGPNPMEALATRLVELTGAKGDAVGTQASILDALKRDERGLHTVVQLATEGNASDDRVVLLVDQFEEVFTLVADDKERTRFVASLLHASSVAGGPTVVVMTMRADFFGKCAAIPGLAARLSERDVLVAPMDETELRAAMIQPAEKVGLQFEKGLVDTILEDLGDEPGSLPLLQHTLLELFDGRRGRWLTIDRYRAIGGVKGAIASRAENVYDRLTPEQQATARRILLRLTQPGEGTEDTRRRAAVSELVPSGEGGSAVEAVVNELAGARLVTTSRNESGEEVVDVAHEALIRGWPRLQQWVDETPAALRIHRDLTVAAEAWNANKRERSYLYSGPRLDEAAAFAARNPDDINDLERTFLTASRRARQSRTLRLVGGLAAASLVFAVLGVAALLQAEQAKRSAAQATANTLLSDSIGLAPESPALGQRLAVEALVRGRELDMDLTRLSDSASSLIATGRYVRLPRPVDEAWTDPQGRILIGADNGGAPGVFDTRDGRLLDELTEPLETATFSTDPVAGVFVANYLSREKELRRIGDGGVINVPDTIRDVALVAEPGAEAMVLAFGRVDRPLAENPPPMEVRSVVDGSIIRTLRGPGRPTLLQPSSLQLVAVAYDDGGVDVVRLSDGATVATMPSGPASVVPSPAGPSFVVSEAGACTLWTVEPRRSLDLGPSCETAEFSDDGQLIAAGSLVAFQFFDVDRGTALGTIEGLSSIREFSPESPPQFVVAGSLTDSRVYATNDGRPIASLPGVAGVPGSIRFSPDGSLLYVAVPDSTRLLSTSTGEVLLTGDTSFFPSPGVLLPPSHGLSEVEFSPDGTWFLVGIDAKHELRRVDAPLDAGPVVDNDAQFWPGRKDSLMYMGSGLQRVDDAGRIVDVLSGQFALNREAFPESDEGAAMVVSSAEVAGDPSSVAILTPDGVLHPLRGDVIDHAEFSGDDDNAYVLVTDAAGQLTLWDRADKPALLATLDARAVTAWDPNGRWLATTSSAGDAYLVDIGWLQVMAASGPSTDVQWLEDQVCNGPARKLVDDAALADRLGEAPKSCRAH